MFKKFSTEEVSTQNQVKSSIQRAVRGAQLRCSLTALTSLQLALSLLPARVAKVCASYPSLEESGAIDLILPKKEAATLAKLCV